MEPAVACTYIFLLVMLPSVGAGCDGQDLLGCRRNLTQAALGTTTLPYRLPHVEDWGNWTMKGLPGPGQGTGTGPMPCRL